MKKTNDAMNNLIRRVWQGEPVQPATGEPPKPTIPPGNAGNGVNQPTRPLTMSDRIRRAAGLGFWRR